MLTYVGQAQAHLESLNLAATCRHNLDLQRSSLPSNVVLEIDLPSPGPDIRADANQLQQVLMNLITNAWEACGDERGAVRLSVKTASAMEILATHHFPPGWQPHAAAYAGLEVADTGCGMAASMIDKIFDPFFSTKFVGRGLGLPVVLGIARSHEGVVTVESEPGRGSVFRVFFPVLAEAGPEKQPPVQLTPARRKDGPRTVLVVEDDENLRETLALTLKVFDFPVLTAEDGVAALELFRQHRDEIGCVLCDVVMPRMNGWETLTALRRIAPGFPVILLSVYSEAEAKAGNHPEQPQAFLRKPCEVQTLIDAISRLMPAGKCRF